MKNQTIPTPNEGEIYVGGIIEPNGTVRHIFLLEGDIEGSWQKSMDWAKSIGGDLPDRIEQSLLFAFLRDRFQERAYWSNTQHASNDDYAWYQNFFYGTQNYDTKNSQLRARAVRRSIINSVI